MSPESITAITVGIALAGLIAGFWRDVRRDMQKLADGVNSLTERMARVEGVIEGVIGRRNSSPRS